MHILILSGLAVLLLLGVLAILRARKQAKKKEENSGFDDMTFG